MKIALAQLNFIIGAFDENAKKIISVIQEAEKSGADLVVFSEMAVCGYPPLDLLEHKNFVERCEEAVQRIAHHSRKIAVIVGTPVINTGEKGKNLYNAAVFLNKGKVERIIHKALLPTYDIFDEYRYFQPSVEFSPVIYKGKRIAVTICEDLWFKQPLLSQFGKNKLYTLNPMDEFHAQGCDLVINIAASPFAYNHEFIKKNILNAVAKKYEVPIIYVNQVGANTELIFEGASRVIDAKGDVVKRLPRFVEAVEYFDTEEKIPGKASCSAEQDEEEDQIKWIHDALILGIRDYFTKLNFSKAILGLSGGIDSAVTLLLAYKALGAGNIRVLLLPSMYSSAHSITDAVQLAETLGIRYDIISITEIFNQYLSDLQPLFAGMPSDIAEENIQARIRGSLLMALANKFGYILLNTSNKSEVAVGYGTLYGDMSGGLSVLGDVYKTDVYRLAKYINREQEIIPDNILTKAPTAELKPNQKDTDSLAPYEKLDKILFSYIELRKSAEQIIGEGHDAAVVRRTLEMINSNEYKRYQTPPILRISSKAFGMGRRMPLAAKY